jgi:hypothetical protein
MRPHPYSLGILFVLLAMAGCAEQDPLDQADELMGRKRYSHAIVVYNRILAENPESAAAWIGRGRAHAASGQMDAAIADFSQAVIVDPQRSEAFYRRAEVYEKLGDLGAANADVASAHEVDPNYRYAFANVQGPSSPRVDFEEDEEFEERTAAQLEADPSTNATAAGSAEEDFDAFSGVWLDLSEPRAHSNIQERGGYVSKYQPGMPFGEAFSSSPTHGDPLVKWRTDGQTATDPRTPFWLRLPVEAPATALPKPKRAEKPVVVRPPTPLPNPYVRAPVPAPTASANAQTKSATPTAQRPTGSPFPQAPVPSTGR